MARKKIPEQTEFPYHITGRCINQEWFSLPMDRLWEVFQEQLFFVSHAYNFEIDSFVLMQNHFHMIVLTPSCNLSDGMRWFMKESSRYINQLSGRINQVWGGRFFRSMITNSHYYLHAYKYVYCNPLKAGLVNDVLEYKYSTLRGLLGLDKSVVPIYENTLEDMGAKDCLDWLNTMPSDPDWETITKSLKKSVFSLPKCRATKKPHILENFLL